MIPMWKGENPIYFGDIRSKVKVTLPVVKNYIYSKTYYKI
jgi:hypothetical protein